VRELLFFGLIDEPNLDRWQAGLVRADKSRRPAWSTVRAALGRGCRARRVVWQHTEQVVGAKVRRAGSRALISAQEDAVAKVGGVHYRLRAYKTLRVRIGVTAVVQLTSKMNPERHTVLAID
jgi:hypothetical protein